VKPEAPSALPHGHRGDFPYHAQEDIRWLRQPPLAVARVLPTTPSGGRKNPRKTHSQPGFICPNQEISASLPNWTRGTTSKLIPALASSACRVPLCEASINGYVPRQSVKPLPLPVGEQFQYRGSGFLDRSPRDVEQRPIELGAQSTRIGDLIGYGLAIDIGVVAGTGAGAKVNQV
jgi:hypothetical protein